MVLPIIPSNHCSIVCAMHTHCMSSHWLVFGGSYQLRQVFQGCLQAHDAAVAALAAQGGAGDAASGEERTLVMALTRTFAELEAQVAGPGLTDWACLGVGCAPAAAMMDIGFSIGQVVVKSAAHAGVSRLHT